MTEPLPPIVPLPWWRLVREVRNYHTFPELFRALAGPVARAQLAPASLVPALVVTTSPQGAHDVLTASQTAVDKQTEIVLQLRKVFGDFLFDLPHDEWLPRRKALQPLFTKEHIKCYAGHMADVADAAITDWDDSTVDLDASMRRLTVTVLGRSVLGMDLDARADEIGAALLCVASYCADRGMRPVRAPRWLPTPAATRPSGHRVTPRSDRRGTYRVPRRSGAPRAAGATTVGHRRPRHRRTVDTGSGGRGARPVPARRP